MSLLKQPNPVLASWVRRAAFRIPLRGAIGKAEPEIAMTGMKSPARALRAAKRPSSPPRRSPRRLFRSDADTSRSACLRVDTRRVALALRAGSRPASTRHAHPGRYVIRTAVATAITAGAGSVSITTAAVSRLASHGGMIGVRIVRGTSPTTGTTTHAATGAAAPGHIAFIAYAPTRSITRCRTTSMSRFTPVTRRIRQRATRHR